MNPLDNMKDIHLAAPIHQWPIALGWWLVALILLIMLGLTVIKARQWVQTRKQMSALALTIEEIKITQRWPTTVNSLFKRIAMTYLPECHAEQLSTSDWLNWLTAVMPNKYQNEFRSDYQQLLSQLYQANADENLEVLTYHRWAHLWMRNAHAISKKKNYVACIVEKTEASHV